MATRTDRPLWGPLRGPGEPDPAHFQGDTATLFDVAIDAYSRRLYYSDTNLDAIMVVDMTADYRLIGAIVRNGDGGAVQRPRHIAVDAENG